MADAGTDLGVDCFELWHAGSVLYPQMAAELDAAASGISSDDPERAFTRDSSIGLGSTGAYDRWSACATMLEDRIAETARNLRDTGAALVLAATTYAATDEAAQAEYDNRKQDLG